MWALTLLRLLGKELLMLGGLGWLGLGGGWGLIKV